LTEGPLAAHCRGRSTWSSPGQVAELAVRSSVDERDPDALWVTATDEVAGNGWLVTVAHVDGRAWRVGVAEREVTASRPASCGKPPAPAVALEAVSVRAWC
jgi:hypothetical protein